MGDPSADPWDAEFVLFTLHYAGALDALAKLECELSHVFVEGPLSRKHGHIFALDGVKGNQWIIDKSPEIIVPGSGRHIGVQVAHLCIQNVLADDNGSAILGESHSLGSGHQHAQGNQKQQCLFHLGVLLLYGFYGKIIPINLLFPMD